MKILKVILATIISFTLIGNVYAISKEKHKVITNEAVKVYAQCIKELGVKDTLVANKWCQRPIVSNKIELMQN